MQEVREVLPFLANKQLCEEAIAPSEMTVLVSRHS